MPRRRRSYSRYPASRDPYYDAQRYRRSRHNGCLADIQDFFTNLLRVVVLIAITGFVLFFTITRFQQVLALFTALFSFASFLIIILPRLLSIAFFVGCALVALAIIYWVVSLASSISERHAIASETRAHAKQERQRAEHERLRAEQQRVKLERERQTAIDEHERRRSVALAQTARVVGQSLHSAPHATHLPPDAPDSVSASRRHGYAAQGYAPPLVHQPQEPSDAEPQHVPGMPAMPPMRTVHYREIAHLVPPGQMPALIRADGSLLLTTWEQGYKTVLIVGSSSSGKTITAAGKIHGFLESTGGRGRILPCDPHESKDDSLFNIIAPLAPALFVNADGQRATFATSEQDILATMRLTLRELRLREAGADARVPILLIVEEFNKLMRNKRFAKEMKEILVILGQEARGYNVFLLVNCQKVKYLADVREDFISYIAQRVTDESGVSSVIPDRFAKFAPELRTGQCFYKDAEGQTTAGLQVFYTIQDMQALATRLVSPSPRPSHQQQAPHPPQTQTFYGAQTEQLAGSPQQQTPPSPRRTEPIQPPSTAVLPRVPLQPGADPANQRRQYGSTRLHRNRVAPLLVGHPLTGPTVPSGSLPPLSPEQEEAKRIALATWQYEELVPEEKLQASINGPTTENIGKDASSSPAPATKMPGSSPLSQSGIFALLIEADSKKKKRM